MKGPIGELVEENKKLAELAEENEKLNKKRSSPRVIIVPPSSIVTRQAAKSPKGATKMIGKLENLEEKQREEKRLKLAQKIEQKQARALKKEKNKGTNSLFEQMQEDPVLSRFSDDDWSENDVDTLTPQKTPNTTRKSSTSEFASLTWTPLLMVHQLLRKKYQLKLFLKKPKENFPPKMKKLLVVMQKWPK